MNRALWRRGSWLITLALTLGAVAFYGAVYRPLQAKIAQTRAELHQRRDIIRSSDALRRQVDETMQVVGQHQRYVDHWDHNPTGDEGLSRVFKRVNQRIKSAGAAIHRFDPLEAVEMDSIRRIPVAVSASGSFSQLFAMIGNLERLPQQIWIEDLKFDADGKDRKNIHLAATLVIFANKTDKSD